MTLLIASILVLCYVLIATERFTNINKAAAAIFAAAVGWVLYICYGTDYVMSQHQGEYINWLGGAVPTSVAVKHYIAQNIFFPYVGRAAEIVLFLLATTMIVEILENNGCFDFFKLWMRTRKSRKLLWRMTAFTFLLSANLDNLTTTVMMLTMMHSMVPNRRGRMIYGAAIVLAANSGGAITVIGDPTGLVLWNMGSVTATHLSLTLVLPCLVACVLPVWWIGNSLPERIELEHASLAYRGDDTRLNVWQRLLMLFVGIGGLWFIPTFHNITKLPPFLGALCVLAILWIVNEIVNRKLVATEQIIQRRTHLVLQYGVSQMMLFVMGIMLAVGVVNETGTLSWLSRQIESVSDNVWLGGLLGGAISSVLDNFATAYSMVSIHPISSAASSAIPLSVYATDGCYWSIVAYVTAVGGNILLLGSMSGLALLKMERMHIGWYLRNVGLPSIVASLLGYGIMAFTFTAFS